MSDQTPVVPPFAMVGNADAPVCADGVCEVPAPADAAAPSDAAGPADDEIPSRPGLS